MRHAPTLPPHPAHSIFPDSFDSDTARKKGPKTGKIEETKTFTGSSLARVAGRRDAAGAMPMAALWALTLAVGAAARPARLPPVFEAAEWTVWGRVLKQNTAKTQIYIYIYIYIHFCVCLYRGGSTRITHTTVGWTESTSHSSVSARNSEG